MCIIQKYYQKSFILLSKHPPINSLCGGYGGGGFLKILTKVCTIRDQDTTRVRRICHGEVCSEDVNNNFCIYLNVKFMDILWEAKAITESPKFGCHRMRDPNAQSWQLNSEGILSNIITKIITYLLLTYYLRYNFTVMFLKLYLFDNEGIEFCYFNIFKNWGKLQFTYSWFG